MWRKLQYIVHFVNCILNNKNKTMNGNSSVLSVLLKIIFDWDCRVFESNFYLYIHLFIVIMLNPSPSCITVSNFSALLLY